jgi:hypothetical protein
MPGICGGRITPDDVPVADLLAVNLDVEALLAKAAPEPDRGRVSARLLVIPHGQNVSATAIVINHDGGSKSSPRA